jgi:hypothetical protein
LLFERVDGEEKEILTALFRKDSKLLKHFSNWGNSFMLNNAYLCTNQSNENNYEGRESHHQH